MKNYELLEHTADIGVRVKGNDLKGLFKNAALAMFDIISDKKQGTGDPACPAGKRGQGTEKLIIKQKAENLEELFINWLNELLSLSATKELIFSDFEIDKLDKNNLQAILIGRDIEDYKVNVEIKAATYHELKLEQVNSGWQAEVIFDV